MKHVKNYEAIEEDNIKKYIIWKEFHSKNRLEILEIYRKGFGTFYTKLIYIYSDDKLIKTDNEIKEQFGIVGGLPYILYTSDDIQDCLDKILTIENVNKFNL